MSDNPIKVDGLGLTPKTAKILHDNGVDTIDDLLSLDDYSIMEMEGLSYHRARKVLECKRDGFDVNKYENLADSIGSFLGTRKIDDKNIEAFVKYYNSPNIILDDIALEYGLSRERIRQICKKCVDCIRDGFDNGRIDCAILDTIDEAAKKRTEIRMLGIRDELLRPEAVVRVMAVAYWDRYEIIKSQKLNGEWLTVKQEGVKNMIESLSRTLKERDTPMRLDNLKALFPINDDMLYSIKNIVIDDGLVTLSTNKMTTGRMPKIKDFLLSLGRPASIQEIMDATGLSFNQVRGAVSDKNEFENVGKNVYDSVEANYLDLSPSEMARNLLIAENQAISVNRIVKYILKYNYYDLSERDILIELFSRNDPIVRYADGCVLLNEWGDDKIRKITRNNYEIEMREAILNVIKEMDSIFDAEMVLEKIKEKYGNRASDRISTIRANLNALSKTNEVIEVGKNTGCYRRP